MMNSTTGTTTSITTLPCSISSSMETAENNYHNNNNHNHNSNGNILTSTPTNITSLTTVSSGFNNSNNNQISPSRRSRTSTNYTINNNTTNLYNEKLLNNNTVEDEVLGQITKEAEARLAARRQARAEAREIRLREIERQREMEEQQSDRHYELPNNISGNHLDHYAIRSRVTPIISRESRTSSYASSRRSSQESLDTCADTPRELKNYVHELEDKFRKAMINIAQLDNEKQSFVYQIESFKDDLEELEENYLRVQRDLKEKSRNFEQLKRDNERLQFDFKCYKDALEERERLIREADLVIIRNNGNINAKLYHKNKLLNGMVNGNDQSATIVNGDGICPVNGEQKVNHNDNIDEDENGDLPVLLANNISLISKDAALMLEDVPGKTLEAKLSSMLFEKLTLQSTIKDLKNDLEDERNRLNSLNDSLANNSLHLTSDMQAEIQREANKITNDLRYKLKKSEQENIELSSTVSRLETQVLRYKSAVDEAERVEDELKLDKRKALRELREALTKIEELESANAHLQKRIDKLKSNRNIVGIITNNSNPNTPPADTVPNSALIPQQHQRSQSPPPSSSASDVSTLCSNSSND